MTFLKNFNLGAVVFSGNLLRRSGHFESKRVHCFQYADTTGKPELS